MIGGKMFWKRKPHIEEKKKAYVKSELQQLKNDTMDLTTKLDKLIKYMERLK
tara:strand:+ start:2484 stop:2639 length:156 start_codon:yes stop_codon:yes gene_type:complete